MNFQDTIEMLEELKEEGVPKNVQKTLDDMIICLKDTDSESNTKIHRTLSILDELTNDTNMDSMIRMQLVSLSSQLEMMLS